MGKAGFICIGNDGHIAFEFAGKSTSPKKSTLTIHDDHSEEADHCDSQCNSCLDLPLLQDILHNNFQNTRHLFYPKASLLLLPQNNKNHQGTFYQASLLQMHPLLIARQQITDISIRSLRTVLLLI